MGGSEALTTKRGLGEYRASGERNEFVQRMLEVQRRRGIDERHWQQGGSKFDQCPGAAPRAAGNLLSRPAPHQRSMDRTPLTLTYPSVSGSVRFDKSKLTGWVLSGKETTVSMYCLGALSRSQ